MNAILDGETEEGLSMLRDLIHAEITFKELARQTGFGEKALHRTLSRRGNPTARTLAKIIAQFAQTWDSSLAFEWLNHSRLKRKIIRTDTYYP